MILAKYTIPAILLTGFFSAQTAQAFTAKAQFGEGTGCSSVAPAFALAKVPPKTAKLVFKMVDLDMPSFPHGGGESVFAGKTSLAQGEAFKAGMFASYQGPCPPRGTKHRYEWTVNAVDADGKVLATAKSVVPFGR